MAGRDDKDDDLEDFSVVDAVDDAVDRFNASGRMPDFSLISGSGVVPKKGPDGDSHRTGWPYEDRYRIRETLQERTQGVVLRLEQLPPLQPIVLASPVAQRVVSIDIPAIPDPPEPSPMQLCLRMVTRAIGIAGVAWAGVSYGWAGGVIALMVAGLLWHVANIMACEEQDELIAVLNAGHQSFQNALKASREKTLAYEDLARADVEAYAKLMRSLVERKAALLKDVKRAPDVVRGLVESDLAESWPARFARWQENRLGEHPIAQSRIPHDVVRELDALGIRTARDLPGLHVLPKWVNNDVRRRLFAWLQVVHQQIKRVPVESDPSEAVESCINRTVHGLLQRTEELEREWHACSREHELRKPAAQRNLDHADGCREYASMLSVRLAELRQRDAAWQGVVDRITFPSR
jgi:hypothetical protein